MHPWLPEPPLATAFPGKVAIRSRVVGAMAKNWLLTFLCVVFIIISLGVFMQVTGDHHEAVTILETGFSWMAAVVIWGIVFRWWEEKS